MNSGAPASIAPPDLPSGGMMAWQSACKVLYWCAEKNFGLYAPLGAVAFSACTILWAISAACAGITASTDPVIIPTVSDLRTSRRETDCPLKVLLLLARVDSS